MLSSLGRRMRGAPLTRRMSTFVLETPPPVRPGWRPIRKILAANRGEIAIRICRAATEMDIKTVAIYSKEDLGSLHRYKADESFQIGAGKSPVAAYLSAEEIVELAKKEGVDAIHPGYGFLSENTRFVQLCEEAGIIFIGPPSKVIHSFGDKTEARKLAVEYDVPIVPGTEHSVSTVAEAAEFCESIGYPVICKAAFGGGGRGMRVVRNAEELGPLFNEASNEAEKAFGDGSMFIERYVDSPRHIEIQILSDGTDVVHLFERDCSVQRRHQKVVEVAPSVGLPADLTKTLYDDAVRICKGAGYVNAGTVEFLVDPKTWKHYFIEVNPRIQVEHTVTEVITGVDLVQSQIRVAAGQRLKDIGLAQEQISKRGFAIQARVTTEDPADNFRPDTGKLQVWRPAEGFGIRLDGGNAYSGASISPHYDSMLMKVTGSALDFKSAAEKLDRALIETRIRGVKTNIPFIRNVLVHPQFATGEATTSFIGDSPELFDFAVVENRGQKLLNYLGELVVNGRSVQGASGPVTPRVAVMLPEVPQCAPPAGLKQVLEAGGPTAFAKAVRENQGLLLTDTTWRDAHQSLLATRMRTQELMHAAETTNDILKGCFSMEMWGGATFDVAMRFLHECPWRRLESLREAVPDVPFQMLLRGANAVGYTNYPDNVVKRFCKEAASSGVDIFRVFDSLNYIENMKLGVEAVGEAGGFIEASICYTGDVAAPGDGLYNLEYYLDYARKLDELGVHSIAIKDMAGLLTPRGATILVGALRAELPNMPIHMHTHDTAGVGVAAMIAAAEAGADVVDVAIDGMSGLTSQPSMGAVVASLRNTELDTGLGLDSIEPLGTYWDDVRGLYLPFESGQLAGTSDVYVHEIPGGQYTNLLFQSKQLGLSDKWSQIKQAYAQANLLLGDIPKVTPSSKVVGDLAQFMVSQNLTPEQVIEGASTLALPQSVVEFFQGVIGIPPAGFPEPLTSRVRKGRSLPDGSSHYEGRPGADMAEYDFEEAEKALVAKYGAGIRPQDVLSHAMYPKVFADWQTFMAVYGEVEVLPTNLFLKPMKEGDEVTLEISKGRQFFIKLVSLPPPSADGIRQVIMELNGERWFVAITDQFADLAEGSRREKATSDDGSIGSPMPGVIVDVKVKIGDIVAEGEPLVVLSAMKMETVLPAPRSGVVTRVLHNAGDQVDPDDLLLLIEDEPKK
uniref:Pyruvate carboxylase n=1 Tax=Phaeocystis antarctica TaxID=33657 RepID=A0A7S0E4E3_9EUKA|mmetsp:Transcript_15980/g.37867  ORF Transcript_15980/g.37867 Transcript_15980/m.37867 type:complete len:1187 (+) Transcript_15980:43-3603(+)